MFGELAAWILFGSGLWFCLVAFRTTRFRCRRALDHICQAFLQVPVPLLRQAALCADDHGPSEHAASPSETSASPIKQLLDVHDAGLREIDVQYSIALLIAVGLAISISAFSHALGWEQGRCLAGVVLLLHAATQVEIATSTASEVEAHVWAQHPTLDQLADISVTDADLPDDVHDLIRAAGQVHGTPAPQQKLLMALVRSSLARVSRVRRHILSVTKSFVKAVTRQDASGVGPIGAVESRMIAFVKELLGDGELQRERGWSNPRIAEQRAKWLESTIERCRRAWGIKADPSSCSDDDVIIARRTGVAEHPGLARVVASRSWSALIEDMQMTARSETGSRRLPGARTDDEREPLLLYAERAVAGDTIAPEIGAVEVIPRFTGPRGYSAWVSAKSWVKFRNWESGREQRPPVRVKASPVVLEICRSWTWVRAQPESVRRLWVFRRRGFRVGVCETKRLPDPSPLRNRAGG